MKTRRPEDRGNDAPDPIILRQHRQLVIDLRLAMVRYHNSPRAFLTFARQHGEHFEQSNIYRIFSENQPQQMSLHTYVRICKLLGIGGERMRMQRIPKTALSLLDFLHIDASNILQSLLDLRDYDQIQRGKFVPPCAETSTPSLGSTG